METWKDIEGYEGLYQVSNKGRVKSLGNDKTRKEKILKPKKSLRGSKYRFKVQLYKNGIKIEPHIHQLVAQAFIPNPNGYAVVHHIDEDPTNNCVENLMWIDKEEHINLHTEERSKKVGQYTLDWEFIREWKSTCEAARENGFNQSHIASCCRGEVNKHKNFIWRYI